LPSSCEKDSQIRIGAYIT